METNLDIIGKQAVEVELKMALTKFHALYDKGATFEEIRKSLSSHDLLRVAVYYREKVRNLELQKNLIEI